MDGWSACVPIAYEVVSDCRKFEKHWFKLIVSVSERCDDNEGCNLLLRLSENISLVFYCDMKLIWCGEGYVECCKRSERRGVMW
jgi:hypothetical protein